MGRHVEPSPGRVNEYIAFACSVLVDDGDVKGSYVTRIERLPGGEIDWFNTQYGASEGVARGEMVEAHRPLTRGACPPFSTAPGQGREDRVHVSG